MFEVAGENITVAREQLNRYENIPESFGFTIGNGQNDTNLANSIDKMINDYEKTQPVRKIKANRRSITGWINGYPNHDPVPFESKIERDCAFQLLFDQRIQHVQSQPLTITFPKEDKKNKFYTPDYLVRYKRDGEYREVLIECKSDDEWTAKRDHLTERYMYVSAWARDRNLDFVLMTEDAILGPSLQNIKLLYPRVIITPLAAKGHPTVRPTIRSLLPCTNGSILNHVESLFPSRKDAQFEILSMIASFDIVCDLTAPLDMNTVLHAWGKDWEPPFLFDRGIRFDT